MLTIQDFCKARGVDLEEDFKIGEFSDGYHTFDDLYLQRCILFAALVNTYKESSWKSLRHQDGELCFGGGWFVVCIDTPKGPYSYHYEEKHWDLFKCVELDNAKPWDGHTDRDVGRLLYLKIEKERL